MMKNFEFYNPVRILFGKGSISQINKHLPSRVPVLLMYGGGSIKKNGVYDQVLQTLKNTEYYEYPGVQPNPVYEQLMPALDLIREKKIGFILAVGGGSVIDGAKFVAAAACYTGSDPWEILSKQVRVENALPIGAVLTLPATGSEMNGNSVITRASLKHKLSFGTSKVMPEFSVLDPEVTYSLPKNQIANGVIDAFIHVLEQYLTYPSNAEIQDRFAESILLVLKDTGSKVYADPEPNYDDRANFMWAATNALNTSISMGVISDWSTHTIGHELTALYGLDHAVSLAIVLPGVMHFLRVKRQEKLAQFGEHIWGITSHDPQVAIAETIKYTEQFFRCLGVKTKLSEYGIGPEAIDKVVKQLSSHGATVLGGAGDVTIDDVPAILGTRI
ncbi:MAG: iron-containing alcohol dehydrogenase [Bacteroidales bacterium]|nr:iron-containing alcohol dehydrogenase [Bacteroidales bacterium]